MYLTGAELLLDRFATNEMVCFVLEGSVDLRSHGKAVHTLRAGQLLQDVAFFDRRGRGGSCNS